MGLPIGAALSFAGSLFGGGGKDEGRKRTADQLYQQALSGDVRAEVQLRCLSGIKNDPRAVTYGFVTDPAKCGWATDPARAYGRQKLAQLDIARKASQAGAALVNATGGVATPAPLPNPDSAAGAASAEGERLPSWFLPVLIGVGGVLILQQARR